MNQTLIQAGKVRSQDKHAGWTVKNKFQDNVYHVDLPQISNALRILRATVSTDAGPNFIGPHWLKRCHEFNESRREQNEESNFFIGVQ